MMSGLDGIFRFPSPWQEFADPIGRVAIGHTSQDIGEPGIGFDAIELRRFDQRAEDGPSFSTAIAACKQVVLAAESDRADRAYRMASASVLRAGSWASWLSSQRRRFSTREADSFRRAASRQCGAFPRTSASMA